MTTSTTETDIAEVATALLATTEAWTDEEQHFLQQYVVQGDFAPGLQEAMMSTQPNQRRLHPGGRGIYLYLAWCHLHI